MPLLLAAALSAHAATFTAEDLVRAHARGLATETTARMAESVGTEPETAVYLLRRGVPPETVRGWGYAVTEAEGIAALRLGALDAPAPGVSDPDWYEMTELPVGLERTEGARVAGSVVQLEPERVVLRSSSTLLAVERPEVRDVWVDARPLDFAVQEELQDPDAARPSLPRHVVLRRQGNTGVAVGALLGVLGGMTFLAGSAGPNPDSGSSIGSSGPRWAISPQDLLIGARVADEPSPILMIAGAGVAVLGGVTFTFGANQLHLAANDRGAWLYEP